MVMGADVANFFFCCIYAVNVREVRKEIPFAKDIQNFSIHGA